MRLYISSDAGFHVKGCLSHYCDIIIIMKSHCVDIEWK